MAKLPPSLLISGTRDFTLSSVLVTHAQLVRLGVEARLHVWEGMSHAFYFNSELPESHDAYDVIVRFFDKHLGN
jgi:acetyl esterase/lipase